MTEEESLTASGGASDLRWGHDIYRYQESEHETRPGQEFFFDARSASGSRAKTFLRYWPLAVLAR
jgi:hypothetical protein